MPFTKPDLKLSHPCHVYAWAFTKKIQLESHLNLTQLYPNPINPYRCNHWHVCTKQKLGFQDFTAEVEDVLKDHKKQQKVRDSSCCIPFLGSAYQTENITLRFSIPKVLPSQSIPSIHSNYLYHRVLEYSVLSYAPHFSSHRLTLLNTPTMHFSTPNLLDTSMSC